MVGEDGCMGGVKKMTEIKRIVQHTVEASVSKRNPFTPLQVHFSGQGRMIDQLALIL